MAFSTSALNSMLGGITPDTVKIHSGDPGAAGTSNTLGAAGSLSATFAAASSGSRALSAQLDYTGLTTLQSVTWYSVWAGATFLARAPITSGDVAANAAGAFSLTTATALTLT